MTRDAANLALALALGVAVQRLRQGKALDAASRGQLAELLLRAAMALAGAAPPARIDADPRALFDAAIDTCREAGVAPAELVTWFNDAAGRHAGRTGRR